MIPALKAAAFACLLASLGAAALADDGPEARRGDIRTGGGDVTLVPVFNPKCTLAMPILQQYRQVPAQEVRVAEAKGPPYGCRR